MLTRTLATLTLLLTFATGAEPVAPPAGAHLDRGRAARRAAVDDDVGGCREPAPAPAAVAPASCDEGQP
jgi:hypothetical protein